MALAHRPLALLIWLIRNCVILACPTWEGKARFNDQGWIFKPIPVADLGLLVQEVVFSGCRGPIGGRGSQPGAGCPHPMSVKCQRPQGSAHSAAHQYSADGVPAWRWRGMMETLVDWQVHWCSTSDTFTTAIYKIWYFSTVQAYLSES